MYFRKIPDSDVFRPSKKRVGALDSDDKETN